MSRIRIVGGTITKHTVGKHSMYAEENIVFHSDKVVSEKGEEKGVTYGEPKKTPIVEKKQGKVKKIELITNLDLGSKNDKSGGTQLGMVFGKSYTFKVTQYENETPVSRKLTKWQMRYHSPKYSKNKWIDIPLKVTGDKVTLTMNEEDMCGRFIYIRAYIDDPKTEGECKQWKHNRFRWFDRMVVDDGFNQRKTNPEKINQHATSLCGTAALLYFFVKDEPDLFYEKYFEFFRTGLTAINQYKLNPNQSIFDFKPVVSNPEYPAYKKYSNGKPCVPPILMEQADWIMLVGTRSSENDDYTGKDGEDWDAINWPDYMETMIVSLYSAKIMKNKVRSITGLNFESDLALMQNEHLNGWKIIMLIDSDMLEDSVSYLGCMTNYHWISYEGDLNIDKKNGIFEFSYYCWAQKFNKAKFRKNVFNTNYYGYIKFKK